MLLLIGTVPIPDLPLIEGRVSYGESLRIGDGFEIPECEMMHCTTAMMAAAAVTCQTLGCEAPYGVIAGCIGDGSGSRLLYKYISEQAGRLEPDVMVLHYIVPQSKLIKEAMNAIQAWEKRPFLIGDAGGMYAVKAAELASQFDLFTPDPGELAFLADADAVHPAYVRHFISEVDTTDMPKLIKQAYEHGDAAPILLVKGSTDYIARNGEILTEVHEPNIAAMEAVGGTGDTITGAVAAMIYKGCDPVEASIRAANLNRVAGQLCNPTPATQISEILAKMPEALQEIWK